jgi:hypothetical protein
VQVFHSSDETVKGIAAMQLPHGQLDESALGISFDGSRNLGQ